MARVFTGKVVIPGDKLDEFFDAMEKAEKARQPFREYLDGLNEELEEYLGSKYSERTARKHSGIVGMFIEFLCAQTDVEKVEDITRGIANTHFRRWYKRKVWDSATDSDLRVALRRFFEFLDAEKGIKNPKVLESLK